MNGRISKLISRYCVALANNKESDQRYKHRLQNVVKKAWNNTPRNERFKMRTRMEKVIMEYKKQLEKKVVEYEKELEERNEQRGTRKENRA